MMKDKREPFLVPLKIQSFPEKAGSINIKHRKDDYDYRLLDVTTRARCPRKGRNLSSAIKHHQANPEKAGSIKDYNRQKYTDGIPIVSSLPSIDRDDFIKFPVYKYKKRQFPPVEKTNYYPYLPYEIILPKPKKKDTKKKDTKKKDTKKKDTKKKDTKKKDTKK